MAQGVGLLRHRANDHRSASVEVNTANLHNAASSRTFDAVAKARPDAFPAPQYYMGYAIPNFYFHMTTAYAILRSNGVEIGKTDFLGG